MGTRGAYYDSSGAMRDMIQSHLLQLLTLVAMEPPVSMEAEDLSNEKVKVLKSLRPIPEEKVEDHAFRAQYTAGVVAGRSVPGYLRTTSSKSPLPRPHLNQPDPRPWRSEVSRLEAGYSVDWAAKSRRMAVRHGH